MKFKLYMFFLFFLLTIPAYSKKRLQIVTTIFPLYDFCRQITAELADVELLLPPGIDIHHFEPRPDQVRKILQADLFIFGHSHLEIWANRIVSLREENKKESLEAGAGLLAEKFQSRHNSQDNHLTDPHFWLDFPLDIKIADRIKNTLTRIMPSNSVQIEKNFQRLADKLIELDRNFAQQLARCRQKTIFFAGHNAFGYLARRYKLEFKTIYGLSPDSEPSAQKLASFIQKIKTEKIKVLFSEKLFNPQAARMIVAETGVKLLELNPGATVSRNELQAGRTFLEIMSENLNNLLQGLSCE